MVNPLPLPLPAAMSRWLDELDSSPNPSVAGVLLNHGTLATSAVLAPEWLRGPLGHCFGNSMSAAALLAEDGWRYCEGYAFNARHGVPFEHAWLLNSEGMAWETTWTNTTDVAYLGMSFEITDVAQALEMSETPLLFGDWDRDFQLLMSHTRCCRPSAQVR